MSTRLRSVEGSALARFAAAMAEARALGCELDPEHVPVALGELEVVRAELWRRAVAPPVAREPGDRLLSAKEAAKLLNVPEKALYRESWTRVFRVPLTEGRVRFSEKAIQRFIKSQLGR